MKMKRLVCVVALLLLGPIAAAQSTFEPLNRWTAAVIGGNQAALASLYLRVPPSQVQTPGGKVQDAAAEPRFWSALAAKGPTHVNVKVLDIERPQPGRVNVIFRVEMMLRESSGEQPFVVEGAQVWIQQGGDWRIAATQRGDLQANPQRRLPEPAKPKIDLYPSPEQAQSEISAALAAAAKDRKRVILVFGANWCYDCHVLDAAFHSPSMAPLVDKNYHVVHINVGDEGDKNLDLAEKYGVPLKKAVRIPSLAVLDPDGEVVYSQKQGEFDDSERIGRIDVVSFLKKWAPARAS
jgi:thiol-disulfide isomerase/thioredoxin